MIYIYIYIYLHARILPRVTGFELCERLIDCIRYVTEIMLERYQHVETTLYLEFWVPSWKCLPKKLYSLVPPSKDLTVISGNHFHAFPPDTQRSDSTEVSGPGLYKRLIDDISRHYSGKQGEFFLNRKLHTTHVEEGQTFDTSAIDSLYCWSKSKWLK